MYMYMYIYAVLYIKLAIRIILPPTHLWNGNGCQCYMFEVQDQVYTYRSAAHVTLDLLLYECMLAEGIIACHIYRYTALEHGSTYGDLYLTMLALCHVSHDRHRPIINKINNKLRRIFKIGEFIMRKRDECAIVAMHVGLQN